MIPQMMQSSWTPRICGIGLPPAEGWKKTTPLSGDRKVVISIWIWMGTKLSLPWAFQTMGRTDPNPSSTPAVERCGVARARGSDAIASATATDRAITTTDGATVILLQDVATFGDQGTAVRFGWRNAATDKWGSCFTSRPMGRWLSDLPHSST